MDKNAIKKYAVWARSELIGRVSKKALQYGVMADGKADPDADSVNGQLLSDAEKKQRQALIRRVDEQGYEMVMEEVAYTWFNRFAALRFMEVNGYLPSHVRVFTNDAGEFKPQILSEAIHLNLDGLNMDKVYELKNAYKEEELFKYLLIVQCNALNKILPGMFQKIEDFTELLLPDYLLREGSVIERMVKQGEPDSIPESDWTDQVQIIGWLYQYYNIEPKDKVFADLKKNIKISKENIPAATQLFTPDWIVRYMVENSLGRLWLEGHPNDTLKSEWQYYLDEAEQKEDVRKQLDAIRRDYAALKPEEIRCIDPCMGSGHILCYMFDLLVRIYEDYGHTAREAVTSIIENNLWGLDIDERAAQLAYFAVMMKARRYDRRFFNKKDEDGNLAIPQPRVYAIRESGFATKDGKRKWLFDADTIEYFANGDANLKKDIQTLIDEMFDAKEYGSVLNISQVDFAAMYARFDEIRDDISMHREYVLSELLPFVQVAEALAQKYHVVCTNPPYMGSSGMSGKLSEFVKKNYPDSKSDLFAVFIERCGQLAEKNCYQAMITQHAWMFLSSFEKLREKLLCAYDIVSMEHLGIGTFEDLNSKVVQSVCFVLRKNRVFNHLGIYDRLFEKQGLQEDNYLKQEWIIDGSHRFVINQSNFSKIPGAPVAYWVSEQLFGIFQKYLSLDSYAAPRQGLITGDNERFLRLWYEVSATNTAFVRDPSCKWMPINKGGEFRRWYGNQEYVVNWANNGSEILDFKDEKGKLRSRPQNLNYNFRESISWSLVTSGGFSVRYFPECFMFNVAGISCFPVSHLKYILGLLNTKITSKITQILNPTINMNAGDIAKVPVVISSQFDLEINSLVEEMIALSKADWDSFETSWDFKQHPLIPSAEEIYQTT